MIPKETKCKYCGRPVLFVPGPRGLLCVEASLTPYRFRRAAESSHDMVALLAAVIYFVWRYGRGFGIIEALFALYGYASFAADICRWMRLPDAAILQRGGRHG